MKKAYVHYEVESGENFTGRVYSIHLATFEQFQARKNLPFREGPTMAMWCAYVTHKKTHEITESFEEWSEKTLVWATLDNDEVMSDSDEDSDSFR